MSDVPSPVSIVAAVAKNGVIGAQGDLPWRLPEDLQYFKRLTLGCPIVMGRKTYDSIGRPLPGRLNIVISRNPDLQIPGCESVNSIEAALRVAQQQNAAEIFIIGGAQIYAQALSVAAKMYLTELRKPVEGDARFPDFAKQEWQEISRRPSEKNEFDFVVYERVE